MLRAQVPGKFVINAASRMKIKTFKFLLRLSFVFDTLEPSPISIFLLDFIRHSFGISLNNSYLPRRLPIGRVRERL